MKKPFEDPEKRIAAADRSLARRIFFPTAPEIPRRRVSGGVLEPLRFDGGRVRGRS
jgi:hypothetical protein